MSGRVSNKVKEVAKEDFDQAKALAQDAIRSAAYLYPFKACVSGLNTEVPTNIVNRASSTSLQTAHYGDLLRPSWSRPSHLDWA
jgi:hypothetical protein